MKEKEQFLTDWISLNDFSKLITQFTLPQLKWWTFNKEANQFTHCTKKIGRRVYISPSLFWEWFNSTTVNHGASVYDDNRYKKKKIGE